MTKKAAESCANARRKRCVCRCGGALHGVAGHTHTTTEIVKQLEEIKDHLTDKGKAALSRLREYVAEQQVLGL